MASTRALVHPNRPPIRRPMSGVLHPHKRCVRCAIVIVVVDVVVVAVVVVVVIIVYIMCVVHVCAPRLNGNLRAHGVHV